MLDVNLKYFNENSHKILIWCAENKVKDFKLIKETLEKEDNGSLVDYYENREWFVETEKLLFYITERKAGCSVEKREIDVYVKDERRITKHNVKNIMKDLVEVANLFYSCGCGYYDSKKGLNIDIGKAFYISPCIKDEGIQSHIVNIIDEAYFIYWTEKEKGRKAEKEKEERDLAEREKKAIEAFYGKTYSE